jgi:hypothetical protein
VKWWFAFCSPLAKCGREGEDRGALSLIAGSLLKEARSSSTDIRIGGRLPTTSQAGPEGDAFGVLTCRPGNGATFTSSPRLALDQDVARIAARAGNPGGAETFAREDSGYCPGQS